MNEKIKNLFNICGMPNEDIMELFEDKNKTFYMEKFAKLIIQECINVIMNDTDRHRKEYFANLLKEHFGVE